MKIIVNLSLSSAVIRSLTCPVSEVKYHEEYYRLEFTIKDLDSLSSTILLIGLDDFSQYFFFVHSEGMKVYSNQYFRRCRSLICDPDSTFILHAYGYLSWILAYSWDILYSPEHMTKSIQEYSTSPWTICQNYPTIPRNIFNGICYVYSTTIIILYTRCIHFWYR